LSAKLAVADIAPQPIPIQKKQLGEAKQKRRSEEEDVAGIADISSSQMKHRKTMKTRRFPIRPKTRARIFFPRKMAIRSIPFYSPYKGKTLSIIPPGPL